MYEFGMYPNEISVYINGIWMGMVPRQSVEREHLALEVEHLSSEVAQFLSVQVAGKG